METHTLRGGTGDRSESGYPSQCPYQAPHDLPFSWAFGVPDSTSVLFLRFSETGSPGALNSLSAEADLELLTLQGCNARYVTPIPTPGSWGVGDGTARLWHQWGFWSEGQPFPL